MSARRFRYCLMAVGLTSWGWAAAAQESILTPASATSVSSINSTRTIDKTIDGTSLSSGGSSEDILSETHSKNDSNDGLYWLSGSGAPTGGEVLTFSFAGPSDVNAIHHWVYTRVGENDRGLRSFDISFSTDSGATFPTTIAAATLGDFTQPPVDDLPPQSKTFALQTGVTDIRLSNLVNFGDPNYMGLSEIRFGGPATPAAPFAIIEIEYDPDADPVPTVTLTWRNSGAKFYAAFYSLDMTTDSWGADLNDSIAPDEGATTTETFELPENLWAEGAVFFRIEER